MSNTCNKNVVLLETELFDNANELLAVLKNAEDTNVEHVKLSPAQMQDADWDELIQLVLNANKVITL